MDYQYLGCLDFGRFGYYTIFKEYDNRKHRFFNKFIKFKNNRKFDKEEFLNEHRYIFPNKEKDLLLNASKRFDSLNQVISGIIADAYNGLTQQEDILELSYMIARRVHISDPTFV